MSPQMNDYGPVSSRHFFVATALAATLLTLGFWLILARTVPDIAITLNELFPPPPTGSLVNVAIQTAIFVAIGLPFFWISRRLAGVLGVFVFTRVVMNLGGLFMIGAGLLLMWINGTAFSPLFPCLMAGAGVVVSAIGLFPDQIYRHVAGLGCLSAVGIASVSYAIGEDKNALIAGVVAIVLAISLTDFLGLAMIVRSQATAEWEASKGRLFFAVIILAIGLALEGFSKVYWIEHIGPDTSITTYALIAGFIGIWVIIFGLWRLVGALRRLSGSLIPTGRPNLNTVTKQKVHGQAGYAAADQVDAALRDQDYGGGGAPHFRD
jgi:hypothetical protein